MERRTRLNVQKITNLEDQRASRGSFSPQDKSIERLVHETQIKLWDTRKSLALSSLQNSEAPLSFIRSLIQIGNIDAAKNILSEKLKETNQDPLVLAQLRFEGARIAFFDANWELVVKIVNDLVSFGVPPVTQLALLQLRANACFELQDFTQAAADIQQVENLGRLYPFAVSLYYAETLKIRLIARDLGVKSAKELLLNLIDDKLRQGRADLDIFLTYFRVAIDLSRLNNESYLNHAIASYLLADAIGDDLYSNLALVDVFLALKNPPQELLSRVEVGAHIYPRVRVLVDETRSGRKVSVTGEAMRNHNLKDSEIDLKLMLPDSFKQNLIVLEEKGALIDLCSRQVTLFEPHSQILKALKFLSQGPSKKENFFKTVWGIKKYVPHIHDSVISSLFNRIKKSHGIIIRSRGNLVFSEKNIFFI